MSKKCELVGSPDMIQTVLSEKRKTKNSPEYRTKSDLGELQKLNKLHENFSHMNLSGANFLNSRLLASKFIETNLSDAIFSGAKIGDTYIVRSNMSRTTCIGTYFSGYLNCSNFTQSNLQEALISASLINSNFTGADLTNANLNNSTILNTNFTQAVLTGANLKVYTPNLSDVYFRLEGRGDDAYNVKYARCTHSRSPIKTLGSDFTGAVLNETKIMGSNLIYSNFTNAIAISANFKDSYLIGTNFTGAILISANLTNADLTDADFTSADLTDAILTNANLTNTNFSGTMLDLTNYEVELDRNTLITLTNAENRHFFECLYDKIYRNPIPDIRLLLVHKGIESLTKKTRKINFNKASNILFVPRYTRHIMDNLTAPEDVEREFKSSFVKLYKDNYHKLGHSVNAEKLCENVFNKKLMGKTHKERKSGSDGNGKKIN